MNADASRPVDRAVVIHDAAQAAQALAAARLAGRVGVTLVSAPDAGCFLGPAWWRALIALVAREHPGQPLQDVLDCGDAAGRAMEALRLGQADLVLERLCPQRAAVLARAVVLEARVRAERPPALDLGLPGGARRLAGWLAP